MRISDWDSDVCSSDLIDIGIVREDAEILQPFGQLREAEEGAERRLDAAQPAFAAVERTRDAQAPEFGILHIGREGGDEARPVALEKTEREHEIGNASCRERVG